MSSTNNSSSLSQVQLGRRKLLGGAALGAAGAFSLPAILAACNSTTSSGGTEGNFPSHPQWNFIFVNHVTTNAFFTPTQYGIQDACALLGCKYQWTGSDSSDVPTMVNAFNTAISAKADGIAIAIVDAKAFDAPTQQALQAGIPVVSYNADSPTPTQNGRLAYIGQDLFQSGVQVGQRIVSLVKSGDVVGFIATPGSLNIQPRIDGVKQAIADSGAPINFVEVATGAKQEDELAAVEAYYLGHKSLKGMVAVDGGSTASVGQIMQKYNLPSQGIHAGGYDLEPITLQAVQQGFLDFTVDQQPYLQGFIPVVQLFLYKLSGGLSQPAETDTGLLFVTKANVSPYLKVKTRFEGSSDKEQVVSQS
ncbi:MAG TPA: sugar ABC transporter substrate-binding protein [Ktedonobacterales bacterium]|nr:sugar ABC transporter substrate-binding protein [Ktedonobacterales bacterium]